MKGVKILINRTSIVNLKSYSSFSSISQKAAVATDKIKPSEKRRSDLFSKELAKQRNAIGRIEKIEVHYKGVPEEATLVMNRNLSTPHECARHMSEMLMERSVLARVNGQLWDMHRPLESDCELELLHVKEADPFHVNKAFWRSCSFMLGAIALNAFRDDIQVRLHSFPSPNVRSGSFVCDVDVDLKEWNPSKDELRILSAQMSTLSHKELPFERLVVDASVAEDMFVDNPYKAEQIPQIASQLSEDNKVIVYRLGTHVDISRGPLMANSGLLGRCTIASVHKVSTESGWLYRFQGVALPKGLLLNHFAYGLLEERAKKLNDTRVLAGSMQENPQEI